MAARVVLKFEGPGALPRGRWRTVPAWADSIMIVVGCPWCGDPIPLDAHAVQVDGHVTPDVWCKPSRCSFSEPVRLDGYRV
jgi:hypothetical protein